METTNNQSLFFEGANLIFKKWSAFRITLDNNPEVLEEYLDDEEYDNEDLLEVIHFLNLLLCDIYTNLNKGKNQVELISDMLLDYFQDFFDTYLEDQSEILVAKNLIKLYNELKLDNRDYYNKLKEIDKTFNYSIYSIKFPIEELTEEVNIQKLSLKNEPDEDGFLEVKKNKKLK